MLTRKMSRIALFCLLLAACFALAACSGQTPTATEQVTSLEVKKGQVFQVQLKGNPTTGYGWEVAEVDEKVIQQQGEAEFKADSSLLGAGGTETLRFKAVGMGKATLKMVYRRSWEKDVAPLQTYTLEVTAR